MSNHFGERVREALRRADHAVYALCAGVVVLCFACVFYGAQRLQIFYSAVRPDPYVSAADWSAPLDDVFIHFDFARSAARGAPFEWAAGNGYSSGGTSLLYPLVLAPGYWLGFRDDRLMVFAAIVAATSVFAMLLVCARFFRELGRPAKYLLPPFLLSIGALDWSFFSGMEVAFFLAVWSLSMAAWDDVVRGEGADAVLHPARSALPLGAANAVVVATRPEAAVVVAVLSLHAAFTAGRRSGRAAGLRVLAASAVPAATLVVVQAVANRMFTGDFSAAGALVKLQLYDPRIPAAEVFRLWLEYVRYQVGRVTGHHVAGNLALGSLLWVLAALPLFFSRTRVVAAVLWIQAVVWVMIVALNGQVIWQNERYTMPALAWLLLAAALGVANVFSRCFEGPFESQRRYRVFGGAVLASLVALAVGQAPRMRDQVWFFARASRNIRDQHMVVARRIRHEMPSAERILVGDAGAIPYASDLPALDIIGLGGYHDLPFARAGRWGVGASLELIERIPKELRPDVMAIYPSWWGDFPAWFGKALGGVSVRGNVICGGRTKMVYAARWDALDDGRVPATPQAGVRVVDEVDLADIISERDHAYRLSGAPGHVAMKLLPHPIRRTEDLWDAARIVPPDATLAVRLSGLRAGKPLRLVLRLAQPQAAELSTLVDGTEAVRTPLAATDGWSEVPVEVPAARVAGSVDLVFRVLRGEMALYHLWAMQPD